MKQLWNRSLGLLLALVVLAGAVFPAGASSGADAAGETAAFVLAAVPEPQIGSVGGEWAVLGLARGEFPVPEGYFPAYYEAVTAYLTSHGGVLHEKKYTEYSRVILALTAIGADARDVAGYDLTKPLGDVAQTTAQGLNGSVWALLALDCGNYPMADKIRQEYVDEILSHELADGGWNLTDSGQADPDITGMVLQALAGYREREDVALAVSRGLEAMSQTEGFDTAEGCAQLLVALCQLGLAPDDPRFARSGMTLTEQLLSFHRWDGSFSHRLGGEANQMATEQALYALVALRRAEAGRSGLYTMDDVTGSLFQDSGNSVGLPNKHPDVEKKQIVDQNATFLDISGHKNQTAIEKLAQYGMVAGKAAGKFDPDASMTRAEFAAIVVNALGLPEKEAAPFSDVARDAWYAPYVDTAYAYGLVSGTGEGMFSPNGTITRQQACVLMTRAAKLCGMDTERDSGAVLDSLAQFDDYRTVADWAAAEVAFCYDANLLDPSELTVEPERDILRCELAQMLFQMLNSAKLLSGGTE
jgi:hypothetical protein